MAYDLPITISDGDFSDPATGLGTTPLAKIAVRFSEAVINTTWQNATNMSASATAKIGDLNTEIDGIIADPGPYHVTAGSVSVPTVTAPSVIIPSTIDTSTILATFDSEYPTIADFLKARGAYLMSTYFPNDAADYAAAESSLASALSSDNYIPAATQIKIWGDDQARIVADKQRAQDAVIAQFAARRFPLPPDVAASAVMQLEQKAQDALAESSRKIAILSVEQYKWVIEKVLSLRNVAMSSMVSYIQAVGKEAIDAAASITGLGYGEQSKLISAAAGFYSADTNAKEMMSKVAQYNNSTALDAAEKNQAADLHLIDEKVKALIADIQLVMQQATAMWNNLHANAGTTVSV